MGYEQIGSMAELRDLLGVPTGRAVTKERTRLHAMDTEWLAPETLEELEDYYATPNYSQRLH
jgi:hypothetical protein